MPSAELAANSPLTPESSFPVTVITNDVEYRDLLGDALASPGRVVCLPESLPEAREALAAGTAPVVIIDGSLPNESWLPLVTDLRHMDQPPKVVIVRAHNYKDRSLKLMSNGAYGIFNPCSYPGEVCAVIGEAARTKAYTPQHKYRVSAA